VSGAGVVRKPADLIAGCLFATVGAAFVVLAQGYEFGTARRMGPGYFPTLLGGLLAALGLVLIVASLTGMRQRMERIAFGPLGLVIAALVAFALLIRNTGLVPAIVTLVLVASGASEHFRWSSAAALAAALAAFSWATFSWALGLPFPAFAPWLTAWLGG
jgi:putative tricarboxylic transport membrane protein